jgi:carbamoyl-phosphate synthase small subunit
MRLTRSADMPAPPAALFLADGSRFDGEGLAYEGTAFGEAVFYTGMTGYEEALTDPSYAGQILTFTYPMIGNYGISGAAAQYGRACVAGAVVKKIARHPSHHLAKQNLAQWLDEQRIPALIGADTRAITIALREHGTLWAALAVGDDALQSAERRLAEFVRAATTKGLVRSVATHTAFVEGESGGPRVTLVDCGVKRAILRELQALGAQVRVLPYDATEEEILTGDPDAIFISPGPGDPTDLPGTIDTLRGLIGRKPLFGICLGHQLLALACGGRTYKLPYGHRGGNQPVKDLIADDVLITAHNHGYAVDAGSLPRELEATMTNLNDGTNEGFRHRRLPIAAVQFHPEASPGPFDARRLFAQWLESLR